MTALTAVDVGYNAVKALTKSGKCAHFPSEMGTPIERETFSVARRDRTVLTVDGQKGWPVGHTALKQSAYHAGRRDPGWVLTPEWTILFYAALSKLYKGSTTTNLVVGLPLEHYEAYSNLLRPRLLGKHRFKCVGGKWQNITVADAVVMTQPYGSLLDQAMNDRGYILSNPFAEGVVAVADLGGNTLNLLATDALEAIGRWTQGDGLGLLPALDAIGRDIGRACPGFVPKAREVSEWLVTGVFTYKGQEYDLAPYSEPHLEPLVRMILSRMSEAWPEPGRYAAVLLTGGGAEALGASLKKRMNGVYANVMIAQEAAFANVRGFLKFGRDLWR